jgi:peptidyl-prolyl cis-trans isomerase SurA
MIDHPSTLNPVVSSVVYQARLAFKTTVLAALAIPMLGLAQTVPKDAQIARIAVVVNDQAITTVAWNHRFNVLKQQISRTTGKAPADENTLRIAVLERLILESLMLQTAQKQRLIPSEDRVNQALLDNAAQAGLDKEAFLSKVEESGLTAEQYTEELKNDIAIATVRSKNVIPRIKVAESEIDQFLNDPESGVAIEYTPLVLLLPKPEGAPLGATELAALKKQAEALRIRALTTPSAEAFIALQPALPKDSNHKVAFGPRKLDKLPDLLSREIDTMTVGAISHVLENSTGFYIVRLQNKQTLLPKVPQTLVRHILLSVPDIKSETDIRNKITDLYNKLILNRDLFTSFAKTFSQDGSAANGGDLGWVFPNDLVPEFERIMDLLKPGEMALPLRSPFGWHIMQVLDRKTVEIPLIRLRNQARNILREQKQKQTLDEWLEQLKAQAYIEYRLDPAARSKTP